MTTKRFFRQTVTTLLLVIVIGLAAVVQVGAQAYGCGDYGSDSYNENCPTTSTPSDGTSTPATTSSGGSSGTSGGGFQTVDEGEEIILNQYPEYSTAQGVDLALKEGQVVCYMVEINGVEEEHCVTVTEVGSDYATLTFNETPSFDLKLLVGETKDVDVTGDGIPDITVKLNAVADGLAYLTFRKYQAEAEPIPEKTPAINKDDAASEEESSFWKNVGIVLAILLLLGALIWAILARRRRKADDTIHP